MDNQTSIIRTTPKDFFFQIGSIIGLYVSAGSLIALLHQLINYAFPDNLQYYVDPYSSGIKFAIASLLVIFPLYIFLGYILQKDFRANPEKRNLPIRKWLVYFTLFVASLVIVGDLIAIINTFLGGEITTRFILKALAVFVVAGLVFGYYIRDIRRPETAEKNLKLFASVSALLVLASIVCGFVVMGSPTTQRKLRFDELRTRDLQDLQSTIIYQYWQMKSALPASLADLSGIIDYSAPTDPETKAPYIYEKTSDLSFKLCADFNLVNQKNNSASDMSYSARPYGKLESWDHPAGNYCFERTIDPELYPVYEGKPVI